jgi:hypothetical protein
LLPGFFAQCDPDHQFVDEQFKVLIHHPTVARTVPVAAKLNPPVAIAAPAPMITANKVCCFTRAFSRS